MQCTRKPNYFIPRAKWKGRKPNYYSSFMRYRIPDSLPSVTHEHIIANCTSCPVPQEPVYYSLCSIPISGCMSIYIVFLKRVRVSSPVNEPHRSQCIPVYVNYSRRPSSLCGLLTQSSVGQSGWVSHRGKTNTGFAQPPGVWKRLIYWSPRQRLQ